jgi:two-component system cell cycle sensor histidine kinase PleC
MQPFPSGAATGEASALPPETELRLRRLEVTSRYLLTNLLPLPFCIVGIALLFAQWNSVALVAGWGVVTAVAWIGAVAVLRGFLKDEGRADRIDSWTPAICGTIVVTSFAIALTAVLFWAEGDRLNNVLLYAILACCVACAGAQSAPSVPVLIANLAPYATIYLYIGLTHEDYPNNLGVGFLQVCYIGLVCLYARSVWQLADEMLRLRMDKRDLIDKLQTALIDTSAAQQRAEAASNAKSEFLANMSHELRTPLNAVLGFSEIIKDRVFGEAAADRYVDYASHIHFSGRHLLGLINDILDLSKIEAGKRELDEINIDLAALVHDVIRFVEPQANRKSLTLCFEADERITVRADERALRQIIANLLSNAVKFTPEAGRITVRIARTGQDTLTLAVEDTGIGIKPEDIGRVLESFGQARHDVATTDERGTGLGLPIVKGLTELHGGTMTLESELGRGTTVTIELPAFRLVTTTALTNAA